MRLYFSDNQFYVRSVERTMEKSNLTAVDRAKIVEQQKKEQLEKNSRSEINMADGVCKAVLKNVERLNHNIKGYYASSNDDGYDIVHEIYRYDDIKHSVEMERTKVIYEKNNKNSLDELNISDISDTRLSQLKRVDADMNRDLLLGMIKEKLRDEGLQNIIVKIDTLKIDKIEEYTHKGILGKTTKQRNKTYNWDVVYIECQW